MQLVLFEKSADFPDTILLVRVHFTGLVPVMQTVLTEKNFYKNPVGKNSVTGLGPEMQLVFIRFLTAVFPGKVWLN